MSGRQSAADQQPEPEQPVDMATARVVAALYRSAEDTVTRVIDLVERWEAGVRTGTLGASWARPAAELREALTVESRWDHHQLDLAELRRQVAQIRDDMADAARGGVPQRVFPLPDPEPSPDLANRLRLAHQARRAKEHQLDGIRRALCDVGVIEDDDAYGHADLADVIRQAFGGETKQPGVEECRGGSPG